MRSRPLTQVGRRLIQKVWKQAEPSEAEVRLWKDMESQGMNHDRMAESCGKMMLTMGNCGDCAG